MSLKDLRKFLDTHPIARPLNRRNRTLIIVTDSKGKRLENCVQGSYPENEIVWISKGGRNSFQAAQFIKENIAHFVHRYGNILLVVWTGTCDLTCFIQQGNFEHRFYAQRTRYIDLSNIQIEDIIIQYQEILNCTFVYGSAVQTVFLECPQYSIVNWNENHHHPQFEIFQSNNQTLQLKIEILNKAIQDLNRSNNVSAPKFGLDLVKSRKSNKSYSTTKISYGLLDDGIHPGMVLSQYWLRKIVLHLLVPYCHD